MFAKRLFQVNGCEVAFLSLVACENDFRIQESLPSLHDKVLAAASDAALNLSANQKKKQNTAPKILGGFIRGLKGVISEKDTSNTDSVTGSSFTQQLEGLFLKLPFLDPSTTTMDDQEVELNISLSLSLSLSLSRCISLKMYFSADDIDIDEPMPTSFTSPLVNKNSIRDEEKERDELFQGATNDVKPRVRTTQEILTQYKFAGDASAAAAHAKEKLTQRQEKLQRISQRTEELQDGAENFASLASELAKTMENKKWWKI